MYAMQSSKWRPNAPPDLRRFLWGYVTNTTLDTALEAAESYFHVQPAVYIDSNGYVICSPERPKITLAADGN